MPRGGTEWAWDQSESRWPGRAGPALATVARVVRDPCMRGCRTRGPQVLLSIFSQWKTPTLVSQRAVTSSHVLVLVPRALVLHGPLPWFSVVSPSRQPPTLTENGSVQLAKTQGHGDNDSPASQVPPGGCEIRASVARLPTAIVAARGTWTSLRLHRQCCLFFLCIAFRMNLTEVEFS